VNYDLRAKFFPKFLPSLVEGSRAAWCGGASGDEGRNYIRGESTIGFRELATFYFLIFFPSVAIMALRRNVLQQDDILCELCVDTRSDVSVYSDNASLDSDSDVPTTSSHKQLQSSTGPLTPQLPRPFFLTSIKIIFITV
jgi:hypothetical protein